MYTPQSYGTCCHPTEVNAPRLTPARKAATQLTHPKGWKAESIESLVSQFEHLCNSSVPWWCCRYCKRGNFSLWLNLFILGDWLHTNMVYPVPDWLSMVLHLHQHNIGYTADGFLQVWWPNQQCQSTEGGWLVVQTGLNLSMLTSPCYNTTTCMQILHKKII